MRKLAVVCSFASVLALPEIASAAWETRQIAGMSVELYTPASTSPIGEGHSLMLGLHGCTQTAVQLRDYAGLESSAEDYGMVFARGSDLAAAANKTLARLKASGEYQKLLDKWIVQK